jgi:hypothetical protein
MMTAPFTPASAHSLTTSGTAIAGVAMGVVHTTQIDVLFTEDNCFLRPGFIMPL